MPLCDAPAEADGTYFVTPSPWPGAADGPECVCIPLHPPAEPSESSSLNVSPCSLPAPCSGQDQSPRSVSWQTECRVRENCSCHALGSMESGNCISSSLGVPSEALPASFRCVTCTPWWLTPQLLGVICWKHPQSKVCVTDEDI